MMKFSTKARYGLRMMVELARELEKDNLVRLGKIAKITGLSENYLAQLAIPLKNNGILLGISGKNGGYRLAKPANQIKISEIIRAVGGPLSLTDCVANPEICMNSSFCETRIVWLILSGMMAEFLEGHTLEDLTNKKQFTQICEKYSSLPLFQKDKIIIDSPLSFALGCPDRSIIHEKENIQ
jgi:Rrf2 family protein